MFETYLRAEQVSPMVAYLVHDGCRVTGEVFDVGGGHFVRVVIGVGRGLVEPAATIDDIAEHLDDIMDTDDLRLPRSGEEGVELSSRTGSPPKPRGARRREE